MLAIACVTLACGGSEFRSSAVAPVDAGDVDATAWDAVVGDVEAHDAGELHDAGADSVTVVDGEAVRDAAVDVERDAEHDAGDASVVRSCCYVPAGACLGGTFACPGVVAWTCASGACGTCDLGVPCLYAGCMGTVEVCP